MRNKITSFLMVAGFSGGLLLGNLDALAANPAPPLLNANGFVCLPSDNKLIDVALNKSGNALKLASDPLAGKVTWRLRGFS